MKLKIKFPFVKAFRDYHEIEDKCYSFNQIFSTKIKCKEVAFDRMYYGLFYVRKLPSKEMIKKLCLDSGFRYNEEGEAYIYHETKY